MALTSVLFAVCLLTLFVTLTDAQSRAQCSKRSCYPRTGDLLVGREKTLFASSTCGLRGPERFCMVSNLKEQEECSYCDSRNISGNSFSHLPKYMLSSFNGAKDNRWWQSENGKENVYLQLDLKSEFHFTHLVMTFRSFRPAGMLIERSFDFGKKWHVYRYFADNCDKAFPRIPKGEPRDIDDVICTEKFSAVEPSTRGELIFSALKSQAPIKDPYSPKVQNLLKITNLRINFTKLHTLGDDILDPRPEIKRKYYYAVYDLVIRGSCSCYGHAEQCLPLEPGQKEIPGMVYGQCNCTHHTTGDNCERCEDGYEDVEWRPAFNDNINECKKCNCNGHSNKCHFDMAVYIASGNKSGGVCDNCTHNTVGRNCESCRPLHYQDPRKDFSDPDACIPCNCDFEGGVSGGECEAKNDPSKGLIAGRCICKANVEGSRCDRCKAGFFRLSASNFEGCEACGCSDSGTLRPCNPNTGKCTCKRYVQGEKCDRCLNGYWGLSDRLSSGCQSCACDVGGSYDDQCEKITGQCRCRKGVNGRKCDRVKPGHYFPLPDHLTYESEEAQAIKVSEVRRQQPPQDGKATWTGDGFLEVASGSSVVYSISNVPLSTDYLVLLRYETKDAFDWNAIVTISRDDGLSLTSGFCSKTGQVEHYRNKTVRLRHDQRFVYVPGSLCLEKGVTYNVRVQFDKTSPFGSDSLFTDSLVLLPDHSKISIFQGPEGQKRKDQYDVYRCQDNHQSLPRPALSEICERLIFSMSTVIFDGSLTCQCDPTGTKRDINGSLICDPVGGQCSCKPNVIGQRCDRCAPGSYGFGPSGCSACDCDARGSVDLFCNIVNGKCPCHSWASGRQCSLCPPKKWGFPSCYDCQCNGHADSCNAETGQCIDCQHDTVGWNCDQCAVGYYGIATRGTPNDCTRCQCPGGSSGNKFSKTCIIDTSTTPQSVLCNACEKGYAGKQCDKCADGYFGSPLVPGGSCKPCKCNTIDPLARVSCDHVTGECLECAPNTAGFNCERCAPGYHGSALASNCTKCVCNKKGTSPGFEDTCNDKSGQCSCLPNVEGLQCDRCTKGYWELASGKGCKQCDCCEEGSKRTMCDQTSGQCHCKAGFGGPRCCDCEDGYWGYPPDSCNPCNCNPAGSLDLQCNRDTGACQCKVGHVGPKCDMCAVDTTGKMPECEICGECYYSWKGTLKVLSKKVTEVVNRASNLSVSGSGGGIYSYDKELASLAEKLKRIREILDSQIITENSTNKIQDELKTIDNRLNHVTNVTELVSQSVADSINRTSAANSEIERLRKMLEDLLKKANELRNEITSIREKEFSGAFDGIKENQRRSRAAEAKVNSSMTNINMASKNRQHVQTVLDGPPSFNETHQQNKLSLEDIFRRIRILNDQSEMLSAMVCGTPRDICGCLGDNCTSCGGLGCNGTRSLSLVAMETAMKAEHALRTKEAMANATLQQAKLAEIEVNKSRDAAMMSLETAQEAQSQSLNATKRMDHLIKDILAFLAMPLPNISTARQNVDKVLNMSLSVGPQQIQELAEDIKKALKSISGIDEILEQTKGNLSRADELKARAEKAREKALGVQNVINSVTEALNMTATAQQKATAAIDQATADTDKAEQIVQKLFPSIEELERKVAEAGNTTKQTKNELEPVKADFDQNAEDIVMAEDSTRMAHNESAQALIEAEKLKKLFEQARGRIESKVGQVRNATERVKIFKKKADDLKKNLVNKIIRMNEIEKETIKYDDLIEELKRLRTEMRKLKQRVQDKVDFINSCNPVTEPIGPA